MTRAPRLTLPVAAGLVASTVVATGLLIRWIHGGLGTALPPFVAAWQPRIDPLAAVAVVVAGAVVLGAPWLLRARLPPGVVAGLLYGIALALGIAINLAHRDPGGLDRIFDLGRHGSFEAPNEYLSGLPALQYGTHFYLDRFAELVPSLPVNVAGHPPGPLLLVRAIGAVTPSTLTALCVGGGALTAPLAYRLGWTLSEDERSGRLAGVLCACSPLTVLFGVTSFDYLFAAIGTLAAVLLTGRSVWARAAGAAALAVAAFFSWALLAVGAWAVLVALRREGPRAAVVLGATCAAAVLALNGALALIYGYDAIGTLHATSAYYRHSVARVRPYAFWVLGAPVAWGVMLGVPLAAATLRAVAARRPAALALAAVIAISALAGFTKGETERIWLFYVPIACAAAAPFVTAGRVRVVLTALLGQALVVSVLFNTVW